MLSRFLSSIATMTPGAAVRRRVFTILSEHEEGDFYDLGELISVADLSRLTGDIFALANSGAAIDAFRDVEGFSLASMLSPLCLEQLKGKLFSLLGM